MPEMQNSEQRVTIYRQEPHTTQQNAKIKKPQR